VSALSTYIQGLTTLVGYWPLNDTSGTAAVEGGGALGDGTYTGTYSLAQLSLPATASPCVLLNNGGASDGRVTLGIGDIAAQLNGSDEIVVSLWYYLQSDWAWAANQFLFYNFIKTGVNGISIYFDAANSIRFSCKSVSTDGNLAYSYVNTNVTRTGMWHNVLLHIDYSGDKIYTYIDGVITLVGGQSLAFGNATYTDANDQNVADSINTFGGATGVKDCYMGECFILKAASNVSTIAADVWRLGNGSIQQSKMVKPVTGYYSVHHLGL